MSDVDDNGTLMESMFITPNLVSYPSIFLFFHFLSCDEPTIIIRIMQSLNLEYLLCPADGPVLAADICLATVVIPRFAICDAIFDGNFNFPL